MRKASHRVVKLSSRNRDGLDGELRLGLRKPNLGVLGPESRKLRATFVAIPGTDVRARRSALEAAKSSGVSSTLVMSNEKSLERANKKFLKKFK